MPSSTKICSSARPHSIQDHFVREMTRTLFGVPNVGNKEVMVSNTWLCALDTLRAAYGEYVTDVAINIWVKNAQAWTGGRTQQQTPAAAAILIGCTAPITARNGQLEWIIFTRQGWLPNDIDGMYKYWNGVNCSGMRECMSMVDFQTWWAEQIAKGFDKYMEKRAHSKLH